MMSSTVTIFRRRADRRGKRHRAPRHAPRDAGGVEKELLVEALKSSRAPWRRAAASLGITERIMGLRVRKYASSQRRFRGT